MPDTFIRFSDLKDTHPSPLDGANDLLAIAHKDTQSPTGYTSMTTTPNALGSHAVEDQTFANFKTSNKTVEGAINETISNLADDYSTSNTYSVDDCVLYAGKLYKCLTDISVAEAWTPAHWEPIKAVDVGAGGGGSWIDVTGTLIAGQTSIILQDASITTNSTIDIYTEDGTEWNSVTVATGSVTITFDVQQSNLGVKARIS